MGYQPIDLMTSEKVNDRRLKVEAEIISSEALILFVAQSLITVESQNSQIIDELKLLNMRIEEAFNTKIKAGDLWVITFKTVQVTDLEQR